MIWLKMFNPALHSWLKSFTIRMALINVWLDAFAHIWVWWVPTTPIEQVVKKREALDANPHTKRWLISYQKLARWIMSQLLCKCQHWIHGRNQWVMKKWVTFWLQWGPDQPQAPFQPSPNPHHHLFLSLITPSLQFLREAALKKTLGKKKEREWQSIFLILWH